MGRQTGATFEAEGARVPSPVPSTGGNEGLLVCLGTKCVALITLVAGVAISTRAMTGLDGLRISNMCNLLDAYKPSADTDFTQSVDELVVSHRRGNHHLPQHLLDLLYTTQECQM